jgi:2-haloacid dehalogenase
MVGVDVLRAETKALVFDQYGTVVDMQGGLTAAVTGFLKDKGWDGEPHRFVTWWRRTHFENSMIDSLSQGEHTPYREIGQRAVSYVMDRCGFSHNADDAVWLVSEIERLKPFPEVIEALERLAGRYQLAILSNGDVDMLEAAKPHIGFPFDHVISVQAAGYFKPHLSAYTKAGEVIGLAPENMLFVANHAFDCIGAKSCGIRTAFIDRRKRPFGHTPHQPDLVIADFKELADVLC